LDSSREHDTRIWRLVEHHVNAARDQLDCTGVHRVGMDETSARKGQDYVSIFADLDARQVVFATEGRSADTVGRFAADLVEHGGDPAKVTDTSSDMSTAFISGTAQASAERENDLRPSPPGRHAQRGHRRRAPPGGHHPPRTQAHPLAVAEKLHEPLGQATR
jgi:hypothetical protein